MPAPILPSILRKILFVAAIVVLLSADSASAQKNPASAPASPKYDLQNEAKFKGTVEEVKLPPKGSEKDAAHLLVKSGTDTIDVYLCPGSFLEDMGVSFKKGDEIALTGSKIKQDTADLILAREVVKGTEDLVLRDEKGAPVWNWHK
jgi:hypothetical protein